MLKCLGVTGLLCPLTQQETNRKPTCARAHTQLTSDHSESAILGAESHRLTAACRACPAEPQHTQQKGLREGRGFLIGICFQKREWGVSMGKNECSIPVRAPVPEGAVGRGLS